MSFAKLSQSFSLACCHGCAWIIPGFSNISYIDDFLLVFQSNLHIHGWVRKVEPSLLFFLRTNSCQLYSGLDDLVAHDQFDYGILLRATMTMTYLILQFLNVIRLTWTEAILHDGNYIIKLSVSHDNPYGCQLKLQTFLCVLPQC